MGRRKSVNTLGTARQEGFEGEVHTYLSTMVRVSHKTSSTSHSKSSFSSNPPITTMVKSERHLYKKIKFLNTEIPPLFLKLIINKIALLANAKIGRVFGSHSSTKVDKNAFFLPSATLLVSTNSFSSIVWEFEVCKLGQ